jgi:hypothetical protein
MNFELNVLFFRGDMDVNEHKEIIQHYSDIDTNLNKGTTLLLLFVISHSQVFNKPNLYLKMSVKRPFEPAVEQYSLLLTNIISF